MSNKKCRYKINLFILVLFSYVLCVYSTLISQEHYKIIDLGTLNGEETRAIDINDSCQVIGYSGIEPFLWRNDSIRQLINDPTMQNRYISNINNYGQITGHELIGDWPFRYREFIWHNDSIFNFPDYLEGYNEEVLATGFTYGINDSGHVIGIVDAFNYDNGHDFKTYIWKGDKRQLLFPSEYNFFEYVSDINNKDQVVGFKYCGPIKYLWQNWNVTPIFNASWVSWVMPSAINEYGIVVGYTLDEILNPVYAIIHSDEVSLLETPLGYRSAASDINNKGLVVGSVYSDELCTNSEACFWKNGKIEIFNNYIPSDSNWVLTSASAINHNGQIVGSGIHNGQKRAFLLCVLPNFKITKPEEGDLWIAGEDTSIFWDYDKTYPQLLTASFYISTDSGRTYDTIKKEVNAYNPIYRKVNWPIPDSLCSRKCFIKMVDDSDTTRYAISPLFKIKGYELTRINKNDNFERYLPSEDGWSFPNDSIPIWCKSHYSQFDYINGIDPYSNKHYSDLWSEFYFKNLIHNNFKSSDFPDWPLFVKTFGEDYCYRDYYHHYVFIEKFVKIRPFLKWIKVKGDWYGSCFGFCLSSILTFNRQFFNSTENLFNLVFTSGYRDVINEFQCHVYGQKLEEDIIKYGCKSLNYNFNILKAMLIADNYYNDDRILIIETLYQNKYITHALVPYKLVRDKTKTNIFYLNVYDPNHPGVENNIIKIDITGNTYDYLGRGYKGGNSNFYVTSPVSKHLDSGLPKNINRIEYHTKYNEDTEKPLDLYVSPNTSITIQNFKGDSIGLNDTKVFNTIQEAHPIIAFTNTYRPPLGYLFNKFDSLSILIEDSKDTTIYLNAIVSDSIIYSFYRNKVNFNQHDYFEIKDGINYINYDADIKKCLLQMAILYNDSDQIIELDRINMSKNDSFNLSLKEIKGSSDNFYIKNIGSSKIFDLRVSMTSETSIGRFEKSNVSLEANSSFYLIADWDSLSSAPIKILKDFGSDGTIDDSVLVENQTNSIKDKSNVSATWTFSLSQNYPNPFNAHTIIQYILPQPNNVKIEIYNLKGQKIITLLNMKKEAGIHNISFNASEYPSGVYLYKITAGEFSAVKKMLVIK